ncbi:hypothetical protein AAF712_002838 [Marasmius tenuissimus]|uniref:P-loop containing nucleoside triphosphate hydrolase protein n=1 Tax=Marasmius tenuissimus TaxID=585030 RepID=A0ABR3A8C1_9AGAR
MDAIKSLVQPLVGGGGGVIDGMKLVVLGGTVETARRVSSSACEEDYPYDWLMLWLSRRPEWQRSREFDTTTRSTTPGFSSKVQDNSFGDEDFMDESSAGSYWGLADGDDAPGKVKTRVVFQPTFDMTHTIYYRGHWLRVKRSRKSDGCEQLSISVVARSNTILKQLVLQAKKEYEAEAIHRIQIYFADSHGSWRWTDSRHKRPMSSIVLNPGVKEMLLSDTKDFLGSEKWYADRGIPFRRGYLLHGVPGSGKSSLIHAIAGELMLDIYVVSLSSSWISDSTLTTLMGRVPARCIVLLEDLDAAFTRSVARRDKDKKDKEDKDKDKEKKDSSGSGSGRGGSGGRRRRGDDSMSDTNTLSLSGLLNALDGVAAAEGRILFATTNHLDRLDPALSRPGRMDVWVEFKNASKWQAEALFRNFFPSVEDDEEVSPGSSRASSTSPSSRTPSSADSRSRSESISSMSMPPMPDEMEMGEMALTKEEEEELEKLGVVLPSPPSDAGSSPLNPSSSSGTPPSFPASAMPFSPTSSSATHAFPPTLSGGPPPPPRTSSTSSFSSWLSSPPQTPSVASVTSALWSASSSAVELLGGAQAPAPAPAPVRVQTPTPPTPERTPTPTPTQPKPKPKHSHSARPLSKETLNILARKFADAIPDEEFSVAALQGYLLRNKSRPFEAADEAGRWAEDEMDGRKRREERRKVRAEKEATKKEAKEAKEKEEKAKKEAKEKEEKEKKEKEEREAKEKEAAVAAATAAAATTPVSETTAASPPSPPPPPPPSSEPAAAAATAAAEPVVVSLPESPASSSSSSSSDSEDSSDSDDDDSDEENLPPGVRSRAERARGADWNAVGSGWN